jgi:aspartyl-tRNA(Asn)/glutamyl-tRNA(Gln) amidotransferase subunit A
VRPMQVLAETLSAVASSRLNAFSFLDPRLLAPSWADAIKTIDLDRPFAGVPIGIKELECVAGWPDTQASLLFRDRKANVTSSVVRRLRRAGCIPIGLTTSSEFGYGNWVSTPLNGTTHNPWDLELTPGGSSGGSAAAVAGGLVPLATGTDAGGSVREPAAYCGIVGFKPSRGLVPIGPPPEFDSATLSGGCLVRSIRDAARWLDICAGRDSCDPFSFDYLGQWEMRLGGLDLRNIRCAVVPGLGVVDVDPEIANIVQTSADAVVSASGLRKVHVSLNLPRDWSSLGFSEIPYLYSVLRDTPDLDPRQLTGPVADSINKFRAFDVRMQAALMELQVAVLAELDEVFRSVDVIFSATVSCPAVSALGPGPSVGPTSDALVNAALCSVANLCGAAAISVPAGVTKMNVPVGLHIMTRRMADDLLLRVAEACEATLSWPLVAPGAPL